MLAAAEARSRSSPTSTATSRTAACSRMVHYDRDTAARFGISPQLIDNTLYDAFGQRQVSTMYTSLNQYHVVMEAAPQYWQNPELPAAYLRALAQRPAGSVERHSPRYAPADRAAGRDPPGPVSRGHHLVQPAARRRAGRCRGRDRRRRPADRPARHHPHRVRRHGAGLSGFARQRTAI